MIIGGVLRLLRPLPNIQEVDVVNLGRVCMRENGTICPFGVFFLFCSTFCFNIGHFPFETLCFWSVTRATLRVEKDKW